MRGASEGMKSDRNAVASGQRYATNSPETNRCPDATALRY